MGVVQYLDQIVVMSFPCQYEGWLMLRHDATPQLVGVRLSFVIGIIIKTKYA